MIVIAAATISHQRVKDHEADDHRLDENEDGIELVVTFIACDCSGHEAGEVKGRRWRCIAVLVQENGGCL